MAPRTRVKAEDALKILKEKRDVVRGMDWQMRDSVRASMRLMIKRLRRKYKYPPEGQEAAVAMVLKQAEALADAWSKAA